MKAFISILLALCLAVSVQAQYTTMAVPDDGSRVMLYQAPSGGNGTTTLQFPELITTGNPSTSPNYIGYFLAVIHDAGGAGGAPQIQFREVTNYSGTTGVLTVGTAFTALAAGDKCYLFQSSILQAILGTHGLPVDPTGAFHAAGIGVAEMVAQLQDSLRLIHPFIADMDSDADTTELRVQQIHTLIDSLVGRDNGAVGSQWSESAASYAAGVSHEQVLMDLQDQADTVNTVKLEYAEDMAESTRDSLSYLHKIWWGAAGLPALTGTRLAAAGGVSAGEGLLFISDATDTMNAVKLEYAEQLQEDLRDSTLNGRVALYGANGFPAVTATKLAAAGGVNLAEGLLYINNTADTINEVKLEYAEDMQEGIRDSLEDANDILQSLTGAGKWSSWDTTLVDFAAAAWQEASAVSQVLAITGRVELEVAVYCSTLVTTASADTIFIEDEDGHVLGAWVGSAGIMTAGTFLSPAVDPATSGVTAVYAGANSSHWDGNILRGVFSGEINIDIDNNDGTGGILVFIWRYKPAPFYGGGSVADGSGG